MPAVSILSDSYLNIRITAAQLTGNELSLSPHNDQNIKVINHSKGLLTFDGLLSSYELVSDWARNYPEVTIIHISAVDIVNKKVKFNVSKPIGRQYLSFVEIKIEKLLQLAEQVQGEVRYEEWIKYHKIVLVQIPDWAEFRAKPGSLEPKEFQLIRRKCNEVLRNNRGILWGKKNILTVHPHTDFPKMNGVHFDTKTQDKYNEQIFEVVKKLFCSECKPASDTSAKVLGLLKDPGCKIRN